MTAQPMSSTPEGAYPALSIIMPVLNEAAIIAAQIAHVRRVAPNAELIVVDGGSQDTTADIASTKADVFIQSKPGRANQMNAGAARACGRYLLFLHADTTLPSTLEQTCRDWAISSPYWGYFPLRLSGEHRALRVIETMINLRTRLTGGATGDQCQTFRADVFAEMGGFPALPLMEDLAMSRRMRQVIPPKPFPENVLTSSRRWEEGGIFRTVLTMWLLRGMYTLGVNPCHLARFYRRSPS